MTSYSIPVKRDYYHSQFIDNSDVVTYVGQRRQRDCSSGGCYGLFVIIQWT